MNDGSRRLFRDAIKVLYGSKAAKNFSIAIAHFFFQKFCRKYEIDQQVTETLVKSGKSSQRRKSP